MRARGRERWLPVVLSVLFHGSLLALLGWGWWTYKRPAHYAQTLAIEGAVVSPAALKANLPAPPPAPAQAPAAAPAPVPSAPPPPPTPAPDPARLLAEKQAAAKAAEERKAVAEKAEEQATAQREARKRAEAEAAEAARVEAEKQARARAEAEQQAKLAADKLAAQKRAEAEHQAQQSEIRGQLAAEERLNAARASGQQDQYAALIRAHVTRQWIKPLDTPTTMECVAEVRQVTGGEVTSVRFGTCNASPVVRQSIEDAIYRASPLPAPPTPDLFEPNLQIHFHGSDQ